MSAAKAALDEEEKRLHVMMMEGVEKQDKKGGEASQRDVGQGWQEDGEDEEFGWSTGGMSVPDRAWTDPCVASNACILWVAWFLVSCNNLELAMLAFLLFCASMGYHLSGEKDRAYMAVDVALGRCCFAYYCVSTVYWGDWSNPSAVAMIVSGYASFGVIISLTTGPWALQAHSERYSRLHPLVHVLGIVPPFVGGLVCKPFFA
eukprot:CAMPEP_0172030600 /NCGR_PEP_ID=MMETSP1041-20130122/18820_1 /TAXON_ID=464988 /ORGANISM="Hemiselmis andersenii, Strain CCMP439" /LENGTH=203 /DNA_ID=CAMNT_0012686979 /DNA_START=202 /DNA_END=813 /DNA_ORIENTATION=+